MELSDRIKGCAEFETEVIAKALVITIGYRKGVAQKVLESTGEFKEKNIELLQECDKEIKRLLILE